jgi:hypothetical protein
LPLTAKGARILPAPIEPGLTCLGENERSGRFKGRAKPLQDFNRRRSARAPNVRVDPLAPACVILLSFRESATVQISKLKSGFGLVIQRKPNLFLIGAMKSGTTYLTKLLNSHPSIFMCDPEEPSFFVDQVQLRRIWPDMWDGGYWKSEESYLRLFHTEKNARILGESSTNYTKQPLVMGVPEKIQQFNPDACFIYIMRDPVERAMSHYWHMVRWHGERRPILDAIKEEPQYREVSYYAMQLTPFIELFGKERIYLLTLEELTSRPNETMKGLWKWLNVDCSVEATGADQPENVTPEIVAMSTLFGVHRRLRQLRILRSIVPQLPHSIRQIVKMGIRLTTRQTNRRTVETSKVIEYLRSIQFRQTEELVQLVGRDFPEWTTLHRT